MSTAVVVDSAAALPASLVERYAIEVVPMSVIIDGVSVPDLEVSTEQLVHQLVSVDVSTSAPSPGEWEAAINRALDRADEAIVLTVSSEMSAGHSAAELAAAQVAEAKFDRRVHVVDTRSAAGGEALVAQEAARLAETGAGAAEIVGRLAQVIGAVHLEATLDNLDHLMRSGRVPNLAGYAAHALHVNPLFEFRDGQAHPLRPAIGREAAEHRIIHRCAATRPHDVPAARLHAAVLEAQASDRAESMRAALAVEVPDADVFVGPFGPVMLVHVGPGLVGLAWWWEPLEAQPG